MEHIKTKPIKEKNFLQEVKDFFTPKLKKIKQIKSAEEGADTLRKTGRIPR